jgi:hypothetical protein
MKKACGYGETRQAWSLTHGKSMPMRSAAKSTVMSMGIVPVMECDGNVESHKVGRRLSYLEPRRTLGRGLVREPGLAASSTGEKAHQTLASWKRKFQG